MKAPLLFLMAATVILLNLSQGQASSECSLKEQQTQIGMNQCSARIYKQADKTLNILYNKLRKKESASQQKDLLKAQLAWLKFRDSECNYRANKYEGGSIQPLVYRQCLTDLTLERNRHLNQSLKEN